MQPTRTKLDQMDGMVTASDETLLEVRDLKTHFFTDEGVSSRRLTG